LDLVDLDFKRGEFANTLSRGQTQRLGLARVLLHDPQVLLLDEPASGLDPRARIKMRTLVKKLGTLGKTVMVSSHILPELADICNKIGIIEKGALVVNESVADVMRRLRKRTVLLVDVAGDRTEAARLIARSDAVDSAKVNKSHIYVTLAEGISDYSGIAEALINAGHRLTLLREEEINLETAFMELTKGFTA